ncbi:zinc-ribbon domain-containing protein [Bacillus sp. UNC41MFS5]|uniref:zinc-ribbon domain-containing protein n=1 Tax=Bacillus sp. UNC41MFS5 TaxID=1449046 RepID=UPI0009DD011E|nr:zinc-ribbon domain-containing protein [Bacillus sp. UNC41MFS5]
MGEVCHLTDCSGVKVCIAQVTPGSDKKVWWICKKGHEWEAHIYSRNSGRGCRECYKNRRSPPIDKIILHKSWCLSRLGFCRRWIGF